MTLSTQSVETVGRRDRRLYRDGCSYRTRTRRHGYHVLAGVRRDVDADALRADGSIPTSSTSPMNPTWRPSPAALHTIAKAAPAR